MNKFSEQQNNHQSNYMLLLQQREEEYRQEMAKLTSEIKSLKLEIMQIRSMNLAILNIKKNTIFSQ